MFFFIKCTKQVQNCDLWATLGQDLPFTTSRIQIEMQYFKCMEIKGINGAVLRSRKDYKNVAKHWLEFTAFDNYEVQAAETILFSSLPFKPSTVQRFYKEGPLWKHLHNTFKQLQNFGPWAIATICSLDARTNLNSEWHRVLVPSN